MQHPKISENKRRNKQSVGYNKDEHDKFLLRSNETEPRLERSSDSEDVEKCETIK